VIELLLPVKVLENNYSEGVVSLKHYHCDNGFGQFLYYLCLVYLIAKLRVVGDDRLELPTIAV
jgi:hypothetical protein